MGKFIKGLLGLNAAAVIRGLRFGFFDFLLACKKCYYTIAPFESDRYVENRRKLKTIPQVDLRDILADKEPSIKFSLTRHEDGMLPLDQAIALLAILVEENPREVLEIGTFMGHTTKLMAENLEGTVIHTVDLPTAYSAGADPVRDLPKSDFHLIGSRVVGKHFMNKTYQNRIVQHFADTAKWDFHEAGKPTFFFIDGSHTYEYCRNDSEKCLGLCSGGEVFLWHDCEELQPGVIKFISEWRSLGRNIVRINGTSLAYWKNI